MEEILKIIFVDFCFDVADIDNGRKGACNKVLKKFRKLVDYLARVGVGESGVKKMVNASYYFFACT